MSPCRILEGVDRLWIQRGIVFGAADQIATPQEESPIEPGNPATWRDRRCALDPARIVLMGKVAYSVVSAQWTIVHVFLPHHGLLLPHHGLRDCLPCADAGPSRRSIAPLDSGYQRVRNGWPVLPERVRRIPIEGACQFPTTDPLHIYRTTCD